MRSRCPPEYQIPDAPDSGKMDAAFLRTCLGLSTPLGEAPPPLPVAVRRAHYDMARSLSLLGALNSHGMDATQLAVVVALALRDPEMALPTRTQPAVKEPPPAAVIDATALAAGQKVVVSWRKKDQPGHFLHAEDDRLVVLLNGDERRFRPDLVRLPAEGEFPGVADNLNPVEA